MTDSEDFPRTGLSHTGVSRRRFIQYGAMGAGAVALSPYLTKLQAFAAPPVGNNEGILVTIQLGGGNDGLNTVIPYTDPKYAALRPTLAIPPAQVLTLGNGLGFHPSLPKLKARFDTGKLAIVNGVHYQPRDLSHFTSTDIYHEGWGGSSAEPRGWLGRWLDTLPNTDHESLYALALNGGVNRDLVGNLARPSSLPLSLNGAFAVDRSVASDARMFDALASFATAPSGIGTLADAYDGTAANLVQMTQKLKPAFGFPAPSSRFGKEMVLAAHLINANLGIRVIDTSASGSFDTHVTQAKYHGQLLTYLDDGIAAFFAALDPAWVNRVTVLTYSEFGRRPQENTDKGTDHGTAYPMFLMGANVKGGIYGPQPSLTNLDPDGNLLPNYDFRQVYATVLHNWLAADDVKLLGKTYTQLPLFASGPGVTGSSTSTTKATTTTTKATTTTTKATTTTLATTTTTAPKTTTTSVPKTTSTTTIPKTTTTTTIPKPPQHLVTPGYWLASPQGHVHGFGAASRFASLGHVSAPIVGGDNTPSHKGLWLCGRDGHIYHLGDAKPYGSPYGKKLNKPIVGMAATPSGKGYWLVASDGGIFGYGDARYYGSTGSVRLNKPIVAMAATPSGKGYWLVASDGGIFGYGDARFFGAADKLSFGSPITCMAATPSGKGYWIVSANGGVFGFGDAKYHGTRHSKSPVCAFARTATGGGYWIATRNGVVSSFGDAPALGSAKDATSVLVCR